MQTNRTITLVLAALAAISLHLVTATMLTSIRTAAADAVPSVARDWTVELDPFRRTATKALAGEFGQLQPWQEAAYRWGLSQGITVPLANRAKLTAYGHWEPCGDHMASGDPISPANGTEFVSVDPKVIPLGTIVWTPWGLRYAMDTGGAVKARRPYIRPGPPERENNVLDYYTLDPRGTVRAQPWVIVKKQTAWNWYGVRKWGDYSKQGRL